MFSKIFSRFIVKLSYINTLYPTYNIKHFIWKQNIIYNNNDFVTFSFALYHLSKLTTFLTTSYDIRNYYLRVI